MWVFDVAKAKHPVSWIASFHFGNSSVSAVAYDVSFQWLLCVPHSDQASVRHSRPASLDRHRCAVFHQLVLSSIIVVNAAGSHVRKPTYEEIDHIFV